jgi:hypothetical protein
MVFVAEMIISEPETVVLHLEMIISVIGTLVFVKSTNSFAASTICFVSEMIVSSAKTVVLHSEMVVSGFRTLVFCLEMIISRI